MMVGFNLIEKTGEVKVFNERISIINFLKKVLKEENLPHDFAIFGLDILLYQSEDSNEISKHIKNILQDAANFLIRRNYIIQIVIEGKLDVVETNEKPKVIYLNKEFSLYPIFGRVKQVDIKQFLAPLNLQS